MITIRRANERGHVDHGWLDTYHTFSFAGYFDPKQMGFRSLRVINDDTIAGGGGFPTHPHDNMEIITYVIDGALEHRDSTGGAGVIRAGDVQRMSAGTGVLHSEFNHSDDEPVRLLQIWLLPKERGVTPGYEQKSFPREMKRGRLVPIAAPGGPDGSMTIHQDVTVYAAFLGAGERVVHELKPGRHAWVQVAEGSLLVNGEELHRGDGAAISDETTVTLEGRNDADVVLFDLS